MRAIDLYSGVGGWSLGLALAGIEVVASYEHFEPANETNRRNNGHTAINADIRALAFEDLPTNIDIVVGSPPCTQFSYSNRGGGGNLADGLKDITQFLAIVDYLRPKFWVMENVPRVADIIQAELRPRGRLARYAHLRPYINTVNMEAWGLPQRRRRCIVGNIDFGLLEQYATNETNRTLGQVLEALNGDVITDPIYGTTLSVADLFDHIPEPPLDEEEVRVNRAAKTSHTIYNAMAFPDPLDRPVRTITATCTRVSRESVVIVDPSRHSDFRRLTLRERASLQGFPISFQFFASSHSAKARMIGNAVPPLFSYFVGNACLEIPADQVKSPSSAISGFRPPAKRPALTHTEVAGHRYPADRTFRFSIPGFNLKSGVRFEMSNRLAPSALQWNIAFYFGTSKDIRRLALDPDLFQNTLGSLSKGIQLRVTPHIEGLRRTTRSADIKRMQDVWSRKGPGGTRPFDMLDEIGRAGTSIRQLIEELPAEEVSRALDAALQTQYGIDLSQLPGLAKLRRCATHVVAGCLVGGVFNAAINPARCASEEPNHLAAAV